MHRYLMKDSLLPPQEKELATHLSSFPWCWPTEGPYLDRAKRLCRSPSSALPGDVLLLTARETAGEVWLLRFDGKKQVVLGRSVHVSEERGWKLARHGLPGTVVLAWQTSAAIPADPPLAIPVDGSDSSEPADRASTSSPTVTGSSLGLSFLMGQLSLLYERPLPVDVAFTAALGPEGELHKVDGLEHKIRALVRGAPSVTTLYVAEADMETAKRALQEAEQRLAARNEPRGGGRLKIIGARSAGEVVGHVFPRTLIEAHWGSLGSNDQDRRRRSLRLFDVATRNRDELPWWSQLRAAAEMALTWPGLQDEQRSFIEFARSVADRHMGGETPLETTVIEAVESMKMDRRLVAVRQLVQEAADKGTPAPAAMLRLAERYRANRADAGVEDLRRLGAHGRLLATLGRHEEAYNLELEAIEGWVARLEDGEEIRFQEDPSYPFSKAFQLAGYLGDAARLAEVERLLERSQPYWSGDDPGDYLRLEQGRAHALIEGTEESGQLRELWTKGARLPFLSYAAGRTLASLARRRGDDLSAQAIRAELVRREDALMPGDRTMVRRWLALVDLDAALITGDHRAAVSAESRLRAEWPQLVGALHAHAPPGENWFAYLARALPY